MNLEKKQTYVTRDRIMNLLSDVEVARVSTAESGKSLVSGDEYLDLEHLDQGVLRASSAKMELGGLLPRTAVEGATWDRIIAALAERPAPTPPTGK